MDDAKKKVILKGIRNAVKRSKKQNGVDALSKNYQLWMGLHIKDDDPLNEDINKFISRFRRMYLSGKLMKFRDWIDVMDDLIDELG